MKDLNSEQLQAVEYGTGPLLIIAGAGTGKTTVITERIKHLISQKLAKPSEILALTFTEKAAKEMEERVDVAMPMGYTQMWISTFHAFCDKILRAEAFHIGLTTSYNLLTQAETIQFFKTNLFKFDLKYFRPLGNPTKFIEGMIQHFSRLKDEDVSPEEYLKWVNKNDEIAASLATLAPRNDEENEKEKYLELANAYKTYEDLKVKEGVMDFSDLISQVLKLFRTRKNILEQYRKQFQYLLVDEFQDTNFAQYELIKLLAPPYEKPNLTVVGDDSQSIYKFRGAAIANILQFMDDYKLAKQIILNKNYRSTQTILDHSYQLIKNNDPDTLEAKLGISKNLKAVRDLGKLRDVGVEFLHTDRVENEAEEVAKTISNVITSPAVAGRGNLNDEIASSATLPRNDGYNYKDFAILLRANAHAEPFMRALARYGIPYQFLGPGMLFRQPEVKDLIAYLKVLANFEDSVAMYRVLTMDLFGINARDLAALGNFAKKNNLSLFEACEQKDKIYLSNETKEILEKVVKIILKHLELVKKETAGQILYYFLQDSGLLQKLTKTNSSAEEKQAANISKFFDKLKSYEASQENASVFAVTDWLDLSMELGESPLAADSDWNQIDAVNLLTVHSSKGLEFPVVFLVNLVSNRFPTTERKEQIPIPQDLIKEILPVGDFHLEEERRLFYVGMTRARDRLYLTASDYYGEGKRERKISPFVYEALGNLPNLTNLSHLPKKQLSLWEWDKQSFSANKPLESSQQSNNLAIQQSVNFLSYSQMDSFDRCPLQYKYRYIQKIPVLPSAALSFGDAIHKTLKAFYEKLKTGEKLDKDGLIKLLDNYWSPIGYTSKAHELKMKKQGEEILAKFYQTVDFKNLPVALEQPFMIKASPTLKIGGKIDRIDQVGKKFEIVDYKTGKMPEQKEIDNSLQMTVYALAATDVELYNKKPEDVTLTFYYLEPMEKRSTVRTSEQLEMAREEIVAKAKEMETSTYPAKPGQICNFCEFKLICEAWN